MERTIGATELRQRLTDVLHAVREERAAYIIETFEREQAALINLEEYRQFRQYMLEREAFFRQLEEAAEQNAARNRGLSDAEIAHIIAEARSESAGGAE
jgi:PHD/YefM family antitoxin component YafN of YafNO toxin-antitoxin module